MIRLLQVDGDASHFQFSLPSLLQLIGMERKTCTLTVDQDGRLGRLYVRDGELLDAECGMLRGEDAAVTIAGWPSPSIVVSTHCPVMEKVIESSLGYVILEAMRREDELASNGVPVSVRSLTWDTAPVSEGLPLSEAKSSRRGRMDGPPASAGSVWPAALPAPSLDSFDGALGVSVVNAAGRVLCSAPPIATDFSGWAVLASKLLGFQRTTLRNTAPGQRVEEIVLTTDDLCHVVRPLPAGVGSGDGGESTWFLLLTFDPRSSSLVRRKLELDRYAGALSAASSQVQGG